MSRLVITATAAVLFAILAQSAQAGDTDSNSAPLRLAALEAVISAGGKPANRSETEVAVLCFLKGEQTSGMNKICYYDCLGSLAAITISSVALCPLSINQ